MELLIVFTSYYFADKADKVLTNEHIPMKLTPMPPELSDACGLAIRIQPEQLDLVRTIMKENRISYSHIYTYKKGEMPELYQEPGKKPIS